MHVVHKITPAPALRHCKPAQSQDGKHLVTGQRTVSASQSNHDQVAGQPGPSPLRANCWRWDTGPVNETAAAHHSCCMATQQRILLATTAAAAWAAAMCGTARLGCGLRRPAPTTWGNRISCCRARRNWVSCWGLCCLGAGGPWGPAATLGGIDVTLSSSISCSRC